MADPASLVLGILPIVAGALKAYRSAYCKFKTFRHYNREVKRLITKIDAQKQIFKNEAHRLLRVVVQEKDLVNAMAADYKAEGWFDPDLEERLRDSLRDNYKCCRNLVEEITITLSELEDGLAVFRVFEDRRQEGETLRDAVRRLRKAIRVPFEKPKYEGLIRDLQDHNSALCQILSATCQRSTVQSNESKHLTRVISHQQDFTLIREASKKLHGLFADTWRCENLTHSTHCIKLCLEVKSVAKEVDLDLILCPTPVGMLKSFGGCQATCRLTIQATCNGVAATGLPTPPSSIKTIDDPYSTDTEDDCPKSKRRKVRFVDDCSFTKATKSIQIPPKISSKVISSLNLCQHLTTKTCSKSLTKADACSGLYQTYNNEFEYVFHSPLHCPGRRHHSPFETYGKPISLHDVLSMPLDGAISIIDQLKLARRVASGILQYHSTLWLAEDWSLRDLFFYNSELDLSDESFRSLHLDTDPFHRIGSAPNHHISAEFSMDGLEFEKCSKAVSMHDELKSNALLYGINNILLYKLGVALLEIGYWKELDPLDVVQVRQLANPKKQRSALCPRYLEIAQRCIQCGFGFGTDLEVTRLQNAVQDQVLGELEDLIRCMDIKD